MPEGDTVWLVCKRLDDALSGDVLTRSDLRVPALATTDLVGRRVLATVPRGKHILTRIEGGLTLHTHLRMDGAWHLHRPGARWTGGPDHQVRVVLSTQSWDAIGYRLPVVELVPTEREGDVVGHLGPDLLGEFDAAEALRRLREQPGREIGQALLDQRNLAGIGNLYKAESLFMNRVWPWAPVSDVDRLDEVVATAQRLLARNRSRPAQVTTGDPRPGFDHWVFERSGRPCRRCGTRIRSQLQGDEPYARITYWCPACQPAPEGAGAPR